MMTTIERAKEPTPELMDAFARLVPQLSPGRRIPELRELAFLLEDERVHLLVARSNDAEILGIVAVVLYDVPTGRRARIEDLVVLAEARGKGVGEALMRAAMEVARAARAHVLDLTSNPRRFEAIGLYRKLGFQLWETNVYRLKLDQEA